MESLTRRRFFAGFEPLIVVCVFITGASLRRDNWFGKSYVDMSFDVKDCGVMSPKDLSCVQKPECRCVEAFQVLRKDFGNYFILGNISGRHRRLVYEDRDYLNFNFDLFSEHYREFYACMGYVNHGVLGDYVCAKCRRNYVIPYSSQMTLMFHTMKTCYRAVV